MSDPFAPNRSSNPAPGSPFGGAAEDTLFNFADMIVEIPEGIHVARLTDMRQQESKQNNPMIIWDFTIVSGPAAGENIASFTAITPNAMWKLTALLAALGLPVNGFRKSDAINRMCHLVIAKEEYPKGSGQIRDSITDVLPHPDGVGKMWTPGNGGGLPTGGGFSSETTLNGAGGGNPFGTGERQIFQSDEVGDATNSLVGSGEPDADDAAGEGDGDGGEGEGESGAGEEGAPDSVTPGRKSKK